MDRLIAPLLELDPDLGQLLSDDRLAEAKQGLRVAVHPIEKGPWDIEKLSHASPDHLGLLVLEGIIAREVLVSDTVSTELLGPGDVVRPWRLHGDDSLLRHTVRWNVLSRSRVALLDRRLSVELARYPEVNAAVIDRVNQRALRLAVTQAISQLNRVDRRLLALFWHLAERWGRMTGEGVTLPLTLSHRMLGQLIGARRPTVSTALSQLARERELVRRDDGTWLLLGEPVGIPRADLARIIPMRRRLLPSDRARRGARAFEPEPAVESHRPAAVHVHGVELRALLEQLRGRTEPHVDELRDAVVTTQLVTEAGVQLRVRRQPTHAGARGRRPNSSLGA